MTDPAEAIERVALCMTRGFEQVYVDQEMIHLTRHKKGKFISVIFSATLDPAIENRDDETTDIWDSDWRELEIDLRSEEPVGTVHYKGVDPLTGVPVIAIIPLNG